MGTTDAMTEAALMTGREVVAELVQMIEEPMTVVGLGVVKVEVATLGVVGVEEMEKMEEEAVEVKKAKVGVEGVNQVAMVENPPD